MNCILFTTIKCHVSLNSKLTTNNNNNNYLRICHSTQTHKSADFRPTDKIKIKLTN